MPEDQHDDTYMHMHMYLPLCLPMHTYIHTCAYMYLLTSVLLPLPNPTPPPPCAVKSWNYTSECEDKTPPHVDNLCMCIVSRIDYMYLLINILLHKMKNNAKAMPADVQTKLHVCIIQTHAVAQKKKNATFNIYISNTQPILSHPIPSPCCFNRRSIHVILIMSCGSRGRLLFQTG